MTDRLTAVQRRELWALNSSEKARVLAAATVGGVKEGRGNSGAKQGAAIDRVWSEAEARIAREEAAAQRERDRKAQAKADAKAQRKGWW
ncbi:hypothetical protein [Streptomyces sp. WMMB303]|uniref:hypothetical protein n=1 Tax=unclassified Streptomyces TaxID=2593676 RepID=UPI0023EDD7F8|nr:hypothetical protein [Streptomyces sp. WMMB303]MDF4254719.1 hypothetical protein [Streptomyces sp. WMMB303]